MIRYQSRVILSTMINRKPIVRRCPGAEIVAVLPEHIARHPGPFGRKCRALPFPFNTGVVGGGAVFFEDARFVGRFAGGGVLGDPGVAPVVAFAPFSEKAVSRIEDASTGAGSLATHMR